LLDYQRTGRLACWIDQHFLDFIRKLLYTNVIRTTLLLTLT
jgi:hypothetical protein